MANLTPEDIRQIVDALQELDWVKWTQSQMSADQGPNATVPTEPQPAGLDAGPPVPDAGPPGLDAPPPDAGPPGLDAGPPPDAAGPPPPAAGPPPPNIPEAPPANQEPERLGAPRRYQADGSEADDEYAEVDTKREEGGRIDHTVGTDKQRYEGETDKDLPGKDIQALEKIKKQEYAAEGSADEDTHVAPPGDVTGEVGEPNRGSVEDDEGKAASEYKAPSGPPKKYSRLEGEVRELRAQLGDTRQRLDVERATRVDAERYSQLSERRRRYEFELDEEFKECRVGAMSDESFKTHLGRIEKYYRPMPLGVDIFVDERGAQGANGRPGEAVERVKYAKEHSDKARQICEERAGKGEAPDYALVLEEVKAGKV